MLMIENYRFGQMVVSGKIYTSDLKLLPNKVLSSSWWRKEGHRVYVDDIKDLLNEDIEILVLGRGDPGMMVAHDSLKEYLKNKNIQLIEQPTKEAVKTFNKMVQMGKKVGAGFHLTC